MREVTGGASLLIDFNDRAAVASALRQLIHDASLRKRLRSEGLVNAQRFSFDSLAVERIDAIRALISPTRR
jgi:glycosyltransferase involved in cell wall biosynthesis